jgi:cysteine sulfinate desulfinase/cysteine desulfurase-like protein
LEATGLDPQWTKGGLRLTVGRQNTDAQIDYVLDRLPRIIRDLLAVEEGFTIPV